MKLRQTLTAVIVLGISIMLGGCNGSNPVSSGSDTGQVKISIMAGGDGATLAKSFSDDIEITSAKVVIEKIEFENEQDASLDFKFEQPFVQDLVTLTTLEEVETVEIPFGVYDKIKIAIDDLDVEDGDVFTQNPELQNLSVLVRGFLNNDSTQTFEFSSDLSVNVDLEFDPPLEINQEVLSTNIVLGIDFANWFTARNGSFLDPSRAENRSEIENNIKRSLRVFEDRDDDGREDDRDGRREDDEVKGVIHELGDSTLVVSGRTFHVDENTVITGDDDNPIAFADLQVGFLVEVHAVKRDDGTLLATRIEVEDNFGEDGRHDEIKGEISEIGEDFFIVSDRTFFVDEHTVFLGDDDRGMISFSDLQVGFFVEVHAVRQNDDTFLAVKVEVEDNFDDDDHGNGEDKEVKAPITEIGADFIVVSELRFFVDSTTVITGDDEQSIGFGDLMVGFFVEVHAVRRDDGSFLATRIEVEDDHRGDDDDDIDVRGRIMEIGESRIVVANVEFLVNEQTVIEDDNGNHITLSDLEVGMFVKIEGRRQEDGTLLATEIEIKDEDGGGRHG